MCRRVPRTPRPATRLVVTGSEWLTRSVIRVHFRSDDLSAFADSRDTDRYVKLIYPRPGVAYPDPFDLAEVRSRFAAEDQPVVRTYTVVDPDAAAGTLAIDFVVHGDEGFAGPWAVSAEPGDVIWASGPGGGYVPDPAADWHLLAGDEVGLPAIRAAAAALPDEARGYVVVEVAGPGYEQPLAVPRGVALTWLHADQSAPEQLADAVRALPWLPGRVQAFVHGEADVVMHGIRPYLLGERELDRADVSVSGYWRRGHTEETFRDWKRALAEAEAG